MMNIQIDGVRWRLRFRHTQKPIKSGTRGCTQCWVEVWEKHVELEGWFSVAGAYGETMCGRKDNFTRETGRQFALVRALRGLLAKGVEFKPHVSALIHAYAQSAPAGRLMCDDLTLRGFRSLYEAVFDPDRLWDWHADEVERKRLATSEMRDIELALIDLRDRDSQQDLKDAEEWSATA